MTTGLVAVTTGHVAVTTGHVSVTTGHVAVTTGHVVVTRCLPKILTGDMLSGIHSGRCTSPSLYRSSVQAPVYIGVQASVYIEEVYKRQSISV